jgi:hypothetical protein
MAAINNVRDGVRGRAYCLGYRHAVDIGVERNAGVQRLAAVGG